MVLALRRDRLQRMQALIDEQQRVGGCGQPTLACAAADEIADMFVLRGLLSHTLKSRPAG
jgi:hypothetical protein